MSAFSHRRRLAIASAGAAMLGVLLPAAAAQAAPHGGITTANVPAGDRGPTPGLTCGPTSSW